MGCEKIINLQKEGGENILNLEREMNVGGAVKSVNGMTGDVVLTTSDLENTSDYQTGSEVESAISTAVGAEATLRANADTSLGGRIDNLVTGLGNEITARQTADNSLQGQIDALAASSDVTDIVGTKAQLNNYDTSKLNDNDIIKVLQDESQNDETTYYRWSTATQSFSLIGEEGPYYTKAESNVLLQGKQDVLTAGTNIDITNNVISATDTTYSAGNAITIDANNEISADIYPADYFTAEASMTQTGSEVSFDDTIPASMSFDNLYGDSEQQTYTGKNLLYIPNGTSASNGITWTRDGNTVSGTGTGTDTYSATSGWLSYTLPPGTYTFSIGEAVTKRVQFAKRVDSSSPAQTVNLPAGDTSITFTSNEETYEYHVVLLDTSGASLTNYTIKDIQLEVGSKATSFEPYVGGTPAPNPQYPQDVHVVTGEQTVTVTGKNLWDPDNVLDGVGLDAPTGQTYPATIRSTLDYTSLKPDTIYTLSGCSMKSICFYDSNKTFISKSSRYTATSPSGTSYVRIAFDNTVEHSNIQLESGSTATTYEAYQSQSYTVDLGSTELCKIGDYQDYIYKNGDDWYLHKETTSVSLDGSTRWTTAYTGTSNYYYRYRYLDNSAYDGTNTNWFANNGIPAQVGSTTTVNGIFLGNNGEIRIRYGAEETIDIWKAHLANSPMIFYYQLATPTDTQITDASLVSQLDLLYMARSYNGETNIVISATGTNLPAIAKVTATKNSASGIVKELENAVKSAELNSRLGGLTLLPISQTDYDALSTKDPNTLYVITGA